MKYYRMAALLLACALCLCGCTHKEGKEPPRAISVIMPDGLPAVGLATLAAQTQTLGGHTLSFEVVTTPDTLIASVIKGEPDIAVLPSNAAASQWNKGAGYLIAGTVSQGSTYLVTLDDTVNSLDDLAGKTVYNIGRGLTPDLVFRAVLKANGIAEDEIDFTYVSAAQELLPVVIASQAQIAVVPEPALSTLLEKKPELRIVADLNAAWADAFGAATGYPQATIIIKESLVGEAPGFVREFLQAVAASEQAVYDDPQQVGALFEGLGISVAPGVIANAPERLGLRFTPIADALDDYSIYFETLYALDPTTIGGSLPDDAIFYTAQ